VKITLSPEVEEYLHHKHKEVLEVFVEKIYSTHMMEPVSHLEIKYGAPHSNIRDKFKTFDIDGFKVYIEDDLLDENTDVMFHLEKFLGLKYIEVDGLKRH
jgi:hypothetical protein